MKALYRSLFLVVSLALFSGCSAYLPKHMQLDPAWAISITRPEVYEQKGVDYVTTFWIPANIGMIGTEAEFKEYGNIPVVVGNWRILILLESGKLLYADAALVHGIGENPLDSQCQFELLVISPGYLSGNEQIVLAGRDRDTIYTLTGDAFDYDPEKFDDEENSFEYRRAVFNELGMSLRSGVNTPNGPYDVRRIRVHSIEWKEFRVAIEQKLPVHMNVYDDKRATMLSNEDFRRISNEENGLTMSSRVVQKGVLSVGGIVAAFSGGGAAIIAGAGFAGDAVSATIDDRPTGLYAQAYEERGKLAPNFRHYERWCRERRNYR